MSKVTDMLNCQEKRRLSILFISVFHKYFRNSVCSLKLSRNKSSLGAILYCYHVSSLVKHKLEKFPPMSKVKVISAQGLQHTVL